MYMSSNKWQSTESKTLFIYIAHTVSQTKTNLKIQNCYEVCWVYAISSQLNKECITSAWSATLSLLSKIYSIFKWFWYSCTLHAVSTKPNIKFISLQSCWRALYCLVQHVQMGYIYTSLSVSLYRPRIYSYGCVLVWVTGLNIHTLRRGCSWCIFFPSYILKFKICV